MNDSGHAFPESLWSSLRPKLPNESKKKKGHLARVQKENSLFRLPEADDCEGALLETLATLAASQFQSDCTEHTTYYSCSAPGPARLPKLQPFPDDEWLDCSEDERLDDRLPAFFFTVCRGASAKHEKSLLRDPCVVQRV